MGYFLSMERARSPYSRHQLGVEMFAQGISLLSVNQLHFRPGCELPELVTNPQPCKPAVMTTAGHIWAGGKRKLFSILHTLVRRAGGRQGRLFLATLTSPSSHFGTDLPLSLSRLLSHVHSLLSPFSAAERAPLRHAFLLFLAQCSPREGCVPASVRGRSVPTRHRWISTYSSRGRRDYTLL